MKMINFCLCQVFFAGKSGHDLRYGTSRHQVIIAIFSGLAKYCAMLLIFRFIIRELYHKSL